MLPWLLASWDIIGVILMVIFELNTVVILDHLLVFSRLLIENALVSVDLLSILDHKWILTIWDVISVVLMIVLQLNGTVALQILLLLTENMLEFCLFLWLDGTVDHHDWVHSTWDIIGVILVVVRNIASIIHEHLLR